MLDVPLPLVHVKLMRPARSVSSFRSGMASFFKTSQADMARSRLFSLPALPVPAFGGLESGPWSLEALEHRPLETLPSLPGEEALLALDARFG